MRIEFHPQPSPAGDPAHQPAMSSPLPSPRPVRVVSWCALVAAVLAVPIALTYLVDARPLRAPAVEIAVAAGFAAMALMLGQFATTGRFHRIARTIGSGTMMRIHRVAGISAIVLVLGHPLLAILADPAYLSFFDPRVNLPRAAALTAAVFVSLGLLIPPLARKQLRLPYEWWRLSHAALAPLLIFIGIIHINMVGHHVDEWWKRILWIALTAAALGLLAHTRVLRPLGLRRRPWRIAEVRPEHAGTVTLALEPVGHSGLRFESGHHVFLTLGDSPFSLQQHPFTICSSDQRPERIELTIKDLGDFTSSVQAALPGGRAFLEGPYGGAWLYTTGGEVPLVMLAGGIGITPFISAIRSLRDRGLSRRFTLFHAVEEVGQATFRGELAVLCPETGGRYLIVPEEPPAGWEGVSGRISREMLAKELSREELAQARFVICGPPPMRRAMLGHLNSLGVPRQRIHVEEFDMV
jgi:predicted ferric reductase